MDKPANTQSDVPQSPPPIPSLPLYLLAGGKSSRFGSDKARALLHGQPLLCRIADALRPIADPVRVIAGTDRRYADLGLVTIADRRPGLGPLAGLETALLHMREHHGPGWVILCSCDLLDVRPRWIRDLLAARCPHTRAVLFADPIPQPLPALYHTDLVPIVQDHLETDRRGMRSFIRALVASAEHVSTPSDWPSRLQANRPEELAEYAAASASAADAPRKAL